jgi:hypothetical protein
MTEFLKDIVERHISSQEILDWQRSMPIHSLDIPRFTSDPWELAENENA